MLRRHIPNIVTLCNLALGTLAVLMAMENQVVFASWLILLSALLDFLDGFLARMLKAGSPLGRQLDSFADLVSFGLAPASIVYKLMEYSILGDIFQGGIQDTSLTERLLLFSPILLVLFSAMRLAEFNLREEDGEFTGLATPASALYFAGMNLYLVGHLGGAAANFILQPSVLLMNILVISFLMISRIPMFSLKFHDFGWKGNQIRYVFLACSGILLILLQEVALPAIILLYLIVSIIAWLLRK
jgi:CDP-diacylglycerol--serine O-phosphatidyltransferase